MNCCDDWGRCTRGQDCPARGLPQDAPARRWSIGCCHSADCADLHCPGRPAKPAPLIAANSNGSRPLAGVPWAGWDWIDALRPLLLWALVLGGSTASVALLLLAYTGGSLCAR